MKCYKYLPKNWRSSLYSYVPAVVQKKERLVLGFTNLEVLAFHYLVQSWEIKDGDVDSID